MFPKPIAAAAMRLFTVRIEMADQEDGEAQSMVAVVGDAAVTSADYVAADVDPDSTDPGDIAYLHVIEATARRLLDGYLIEDVTVIGERCS